MRAFFGLAMQLFHLAVSQLSHQHSPMKQPADRLLIMTAGCSAAEEAKREEDACRQQSLLVGTSGDGP